MRYRYVKLKDVIKDFLKENGLDLRDIIDAMNESREDIRESLKRRTWLTKKQLSFLIQAFSVQELNLLIFALQTFYLINPSGLYKGAIIIPRREDIIRDGKATPNGIRLLTKELNLRGLWTKASKI